MSTFFPELIAWLGGGFVLAVTASLSLLLYTLDGINGIFLGACTIFGILALASAGAHFLG
jgi:hypothetical protein